MALTDGSGVLGPIAINGAGVAVPALGKAGGAVIGAPAGPGYMFGTPSGATDAGPAGGYQFGTPSGATDSALGAAQQTYGANPTGPSLGSATYGDSSIPALTNTTETAAGKTGMAGKAAALLSFQPASLWGGGQAAVEGGGLLDAGGALGAGSLGRGGAYAIGGQVAGGLLRGVIGQTDGKWDDAAVGAVKGAGIGAGFGSMVPVVGTAIGAGVGAAIGGVTGYFTGHDSDTTEAAHYLNNEFNPTNPKGLAATLTASGISDTTVQQTIAQFQALGDQVSNKKDAQALIGQVLTAIPQLQAQDKQTQLASQQAQQQQAQSAAIQSYLGPAIQQQMQQYNQAAGESSAMMTSAANVPGVDPTLAAIYKAHAANMLADSRQAGLGYMAQIAAAPQLYGGVPSSVSPSSVAGANATLPQVLPSSTAGMSAADQLAYNHALAVASGTTAGKTPTAAASTSGTFKP